MDHTYHPNKRECGDGRDTPPHTTGIGNSQPCFMHPDEGTYVLREVRVVEMDMIAMSAMNHFSIAVE